MARPTTNDHEVAERLVGVALELYASKRPEDVTVRAVATAAGASTTAIYSLFGGKEGLADAVRARAVAGLFGAFSAVPVTDDPVADLTALGRAYLAWAEENPGLYAALFRGSVTMTPGGPAGEDDSAAPLMAAIDRAIASGAMVGEPAVMAASLWAAVHGMAMLVADGVIDHASAAVAGPALVTAVVRGWAPPR